MRNNFEKLRSHMFIDASTSLAAKQRHKWSTITSAVFYERAVGGIVNNMLSCCLRKLRKEIKCRRPDSTKTDLFGGLGVRYAGEPLIHQTT